MKVHEAITEVMKAVPVVKKEDRNQQQNFNFRGIDAVLNAVGPQLRKHGVIVLPQLQEHHAKAVTVGRNNTAMNAVTVLVKYVFIGPEGDTLEVEVPGEAMDAGDKAYSKAMSVAFRTALLQTLALPTDEKDPDSDAYEDVKPDTADRDAAEKRLLAVVRELKLVPGDVAKLYLADHGYSVQAEQDATKLHEFTERLAPNKAIEK